MTVILLMATRTAGSLQDLSSFVPQDHSYSSLANMPQDSPYKIGFRGKKDDLKKKNIATYFKHFNYFERMAFF